MPTAAKDEAEDTDESSVDSFVFESSVDSPVNPSDDEGALGVEGFFGTDMFDSRLPVCAEAIEAQAIGFRVDFIDEHLSEVCPLGGCDEALEDGVLHALAEVFAHLCDVLEASAAGFGFDAYVVCNEHHH